MYVFSKYKILKIYGLYIFDIWDNLDMNLTDEERDFLVTPKALPSSTHYYNLRKVLPRSKWDKLRKLTYERANFTCELCNSKPKRLEAHEMWYFDFKNKIQYLQRMIALCYKCHSLQHTMLLKLQHDKGFRNADYVVSHFNKIAKQKVTFTQFFAIGNAVQQELEKFVWDVVVYKELDELLGGL